MEKGMNLEHDLELLSTVNNNFSSCQLLGCNYVCIWFKLTAKKVFYLNFSEKKKEIYG